MKPTSSKKWLVVALLLANGWLAGAQSTKTPGPTDYAAFSRFITERNIFNPNRYSHNTPAPKSTYHAPVTRATPAFTLVGIMDYHKGLFAFFDGTNPELRKVLYATDTNSIAGYTVAEITLNGVELVAADKTNTVALKIGDVMRQVGYEWRPSGQGELPPDTSDTATSAATSSPAAGAAPSAAGEPNDILKKLMEKRAKELQ